MQDRMNSSYSNKEELEILSLSSINQNVERLTVLGKVEKGSKPGTETNIIMNDPNMSEKWGLQLTDSKSAWNLSKGSKDIIVAVIDTGMDINHEDLKDNLWVNKGETGKDKKGRDKATNGVDDDKNGYIDDVHGWNFVSRNHDLTDNHGHGTHISGILGAKGGNGKGVSGVSPNVSIMTLKYFDPNSPGMNNLENTVKSIHYAVENGARIINYSGGGLEFSKQEKEAIEKAQKKGILFVAAAGNERSNSDKKKYYPADYELSNIISVTAIDPDKNVLPSSNYGIITVDIAAPGKRIYSTLPKGRYGPMTGTSQATAFVSGVAALLMAHNPDFDANQVAKYIKQTGDVMESLKGKTRYNRKLNSYRALSILDQNVGATGVVAGNTSNLPEEGFASEKFKYENDDKSVLNMKFSSALMAKIKTAKRQLNSEKSASDNKKRRPNQQQADEAGKKPSQQK
jgi:subtilisin family serine protease